MKLVIAAVGRVKEPGLRAVLDDYYKRARRYCALDEVELREDREDRVSQSFAQCLSSQGPRGELVTLEIDGEPLSSERFAARLDGVLQRAAVPVFAIGGADGLPDAVRARSRWRLSFGPMTLPHRLARVVLAEQVYRAFTILRGEPYHH